MSNTVKFNNKTNFSESTSLWTPSSTCNPDRIAFFMPTLGGGGAERVMLQLAESFARSNLEIDLVLANATGSLENEVPKNVSLIDFKSKRVSLCLKPLIRYLRNDRPFAILSTIGHANVIALMARSISRIPTRIIIRESTTPSVFLANTTKFRSRLMPFFSRYLYPRADGIIAVSSGVADDISRLLDLPRSKVEVIYNPVDIESLTRLSLQEQGHQWCTDRHQVILGVGRLVNQKGFSTLIRAFALVRRNRQAKLVILGEGPERANLERLIAELGVEDDVSMPGFVANPYAFMRTSSVFVLSSEFEGMPNALIQALALRCPVVSTDCESGPREILQNGKYGKLVPVGDVTQLATAISESMDSPKTVCEEYIKKSYDLNLISKKYLELILGF